MPKNDDPIQDDSIDDLAEAIRVLACELKAGREQRAELCVTRIDLAAAESRIVAELRSMKLDVVTASDLHAMEAIEARTAELARKLKILDAST